MNGTAKVTDFSIDDLNVENLQQLMRDINAFPKQIAYISVPRATIVRMIEIVIQQRKPRILI